MLQREIFAQRLRDLREEAGEDRKTLADFLGVSVSQVSEMENGRKGTTMERLVLLCEHYKVSADYLLGLSDKKERTV
jgi:transcriptional regulator with XRE-family HTH domain